ncbi:imidazolonepropionase-like amidohydrolase [Desulfitispora alkaliphila]|uniref:amidohydrolase n=1 Tax=Desulfitispora alkaliphila TaxID=622674 RepID=UPI003D1D4C27
MKALVNGTIIDVVGRREFRGTIVIDGDRIASVIEGDNVPQGAEVEDMTGNYLMPGMIDAHTHVGILEEIYRIEGDDVNEVSDPATPHLRAIDAINPKDVSLADARSAGITVVVSGPGSANVIGGQNLVMKTSGDVIDDMVLVDPVGLKVAFGENPKNVYGQGQKKTPFTRMGTAAILRENLVKADTYLKKLRVGEKVDRDLKLEALALVLERKIPLRAHAHRADDIMTAIRIAGEFSVDLIIEHCTEGHEIVEQLKKHNVPVVIGPSLMGRAKVELGDRSFKTAGILASNGIKVALTTDHPVVPINYLPLCAALAVKAGMDQWDALQAITINPAEIIGISDERGSLEVGKKADLVVAAGEPLDIRTKVLSVYQDGKKLQISTK